MVLRSRLVQSPIVVEPMKLELVLPETSSTKRHQGLPLIRVLAATVAISVVVLEAGD